MAAHEYDDYGERITRVYAEQLDGMRQGLLAVNRNVLRYIADGRDRGEQIDALAVQLDTVARQSEVTAQQTAAMSRQIETIVTQLGICANELGRLKPLTMWQRGMGVALIVLAFGVIALLIRVF